MGTKFVPKNKKIRSLSNDKIDEFCSDDQSMPHMTDEHDITIPNIYSMEKHNGPRSPSLKECEIHSSNNSGYLKLN